MPNPDEVHILLAADSEHDARTFRHILKDYRRPHQVTHCARAEQAIDLVTRDPASFGVLVSDFNMPGIDGLELCETLLAMKVPFPLIILTGTGSEKIAAQALRLGVDDYIIKDPAEGYRELVLETLDKVLRKHADRLARERAETALREAYDRVEQQVQERTADLQSANAALLTKLRELEEAKNALSESEGRLRQAVRLAGMGHSIWDSVTDQCHYCSQRHAEIHGLSVSDYLARASSRDGALSLVHPEDRQAYRSRMKAMQDGKMFDMEYRLVTPAGETRYVHEMAESLFDENGTLVQEIFTIQDITDNKAAEEELRHAQKMEAMGQLTGGVAHDFNNLLAIIMGNSELAVERSDEKTAELLNPVIRAAVRGAELTHRLLAFSRREPLSRATIDVADLVLGMDNLLARVLGEAIEFDILASKEVWGSVADMGQLENALLNLAVNAQQAMPLGGTLFIEARNVSLDEDFAAAHAGSKPGDYVMIAVSDTGEGMPPDVVARVFEPFFTTKGLGEGTGLGLSMVYGFAKQSGGFVWIDSEVGKGTVVRLYLPRSDDSDPAKAAALPLEEPRGRGESILVVEDDSDVRTLAVKMLESLNYEVHEACDGLSALMAMTIQPNIDLLLSDVVLPGGKSGVELAEEVGASFPAMKVMLMSGYSDRMQDHYDLADTWTPLSKPFKRHELAQRVREALDSRVAGS